MNTLAASAQPAPNTCVAGKIDCVTKEATAFLKCWAKAQKTGALVDDACLGKARDKFLGAPTLDGCFDKLEGKQNPAKPATVCRTDDDDALIDALTDALTETVACGSDPLSCGGSCTHSPCVEGAALDECSPCVERVCSQPFLADCCSSGWDAACVAAAGHLCGPDCASAASDGPNGCAAGKSACVANKIKGLLGCYNKAQKLGVDVDPACLQKVQDKFDGGTDPSKGCFAKLEAKQNAAKPASLCRDDVTDAGAFAEYASETLACDLGSDSCPCSGGRCVDAVDDVPDAVVERPLDMVCSRTCKVKTHFSPESGTCTGCAYGEICVDGECQCEVGAPRCQEIAPIPTCVNVSASTGLPSCGFLKNPNLVPAAPGGTLPPIGPGSHGTGWIDHFFEIEAYENEPVLIYLDAKQLGPLLGTDYTPIVFSCDSTNGTFKAQDDEFQRNYIDADGNILDVPGFLAETNTSLACKSFVDGPTYRGLPPLDPFSNPDLKGYYLIFTPDPGESGRRYNHISILIDDSSSRLPAEGYLPFHVLWFTIHVNPGPPPVPGPL